MGKATCNWQPLLWVVALVTFLVAISPAPSAAQRRGRLRTQITTLSAELVELKGQMAQLRTQMEDAARPGQSGICADPCAEDSDGDGANDCEDLCPCDPNNADSDGDKVPDCFDPCPDDGTDACIDPCRMDSDGDGQNDCEDPCPSDPNPPGDTDGDSIPDCQDPCPDDATNSCFDQCKADGSCPPVGGGMNGR